MATLATTNSILTSLERQLPAHNVPGSALLHLVNGVINVPPTDVAELMTELHINDPNTAIEQLCIGLVRDDMEENRNYGCGSEEEAERFCEMAEKCVQYLACVGLKEQGAFGGRIGVPKYPFAVKYGWRVDKTMVLMGIRIFVAIIVVGELLGVMGVL